MSYVHYSHSMMHHHHHPTPQVFGYMPPPGAPTAMPRMAMAPLSPALPEGQLYHLYCQYGVDLIRSAGLTLAKERALDMSPSILYHASVLFQRFEAIVQSRFRSRYKKTSSLYQNVPDTPEQGQEPEEKMEYSAPDLLIPLLSGVRPLSDLFAPLDYCALSLAMENDDIVYLAAACLLLSVKWMDNWVAFEPGRIRLVINSFLRLSLTRTQTPLLLDSPVAVMESRFEDFKACVLQAEEQLSQTLGFQIGFVETPYKYLLFFLHLLLEEEDVQAGSPLLRNPHTLKNPSLPRSAAYLVWLRNATSVLNDVPRNQELLLFSNSALAVYAIHASRPNGIRRQPDDPESAVAEVTLPPQWTLSFGVSEAALEEMCQAADAIKACRYPSMMLPALLQQLGRPNYKEEERLKAEREKALEELQTERRRAREAPVAPPTALPSQSSVQTGGRKTSGANPMSSSTDSSDDEDDILLSAKRRKERRRAEKMKKAAEKKAVEKEGKSGKGERSSTAAKERSDARGGPDEPRKRRRSHSGDRHDRRHRHSPARHDRDRDRDRDRKERDDRRGHRSGREPEKARGSAGGGKRYDLNRKRHTDRR